MRKPILIFTAIFAGIVFPFGHAYTFLIRYLIMAILFLAFLDLRVSHKSIQREHIWVVLLNLLLPLVFFIILYPLNDTVAMVAFVIAVSPTAANGPIIADLLRIDVSFVTLSVLLTSISVAFLIPFILPQLMEVSQKIDVSAVLFPVFILVFIPLLIAQLIRYGSSRIHQKLLAFKGIGFYLFITNVFIASGKASHFVQMDKQTGWRTILGIALLSGVLCFLNFSIGRALAKDQSPIATSIALGRKNNMFALWLSLTFTTPVIALGPIFYIVYQNIYNSWQLWQMEKKS
ncbi:MAG: hypothetical protein AAF985_01715 [Bacteroidota bacterium]